MFYNPLYIILLLLFSHTLTCSIDYVCFQFLNKLGLCHRVATLLSQQGGVMRQYATAATVKPFKYQDILEFERAPDIPWRKLTRSSSSCFVRDIYC